MQAFPCILYRRARFEPMDIVIGLKGRGQGHLVSGALEKPAYCRRKKFDIH
jgi:hypothetical protein